jgi:hypothetical protein
VRWALKRPIHLGYEKHASIVQGSGNSRNGTSSKTLMGDFGEVEIEVPRDRNDTFEPKLVSKHQRRFAGFDDKILSMYARGMSTRLFALSHSAVASLTLPLTRLRRPVCRRTLTRYVRNLGAG